jgi:hypothetical protein
MKRDRELQIKILRQVRDRIEYPVFQETPQEQLAYNAGLLIDEGLVDGKKAKGNQGQVVGTALISLTPAGHDFLEAIDRAAEAHISNQSTAQSMTIFISHSSQDAELAGKLAKLCQLAFTLPASEIRCTSVNGYKLEVGADTDEVLRREVKESKLFLALITPTSIRSSYVLCELGGRWCTELPMFPVMGRGATSRSLEGPLGGINALNLEHRPEVLQLLENMGKNLDRDMASASSIDDAIAAVCEAASKAEIEMPSKRSIEAKANDPLDTEDTRILHYIDEAHPHHPDINELSEKLGIRLRDVEYSIRKMAKQGFVSEKPLTKQLWHVGHPNPDGYFVLDKGIEYIRANMKKSGTSRSGLASD